jgi:hypothetical protein
MLGIHFYALLLEPAKPGTLDLLIPPFTGGICTWGFQIISTPIVHWKNIPVFNVFSTTIFTAIPHPENYEAKR